MTSWVLIADSSRATLFRADKAMSPLQEIASFSHPATRTRGLDGESSLEESATVKRQQSLLFAKQLSDQLKTGRLQKLFDKLYIAAAPAFLGVLRNKLDAPTSQLVAGEVSKDLTQLDPSIIRRHLPDRL